MAMGRRNSQPNATGYRTRAEVKRWGIEKKMTKKELNLEIGDRSAAAIEMGQEVVLAGALRSIVCAFVRFALGKG